MILINALGIKDSGGITVLDKLLSECKGSKHNLLVICYENSNISKLINKYKVYNNLIFYIIDNRGFLYRVYYENIVFNKIIKNNNIGLVYNFSGSAQFFSHIPQLVKIHNLVFYTKKLDKIYKKNDKFILWLSQIFFKRIVFKTMISKAKYFEIQSPHVKDYMSEYIDIKNKKFYIKSDINVSNNVFKKPKEYDFSKKIKFLYIIGPHFEYVHKNFLDFTNIMLELDKKNFDFEINITLTKEQLNNSSLWDNSLNSKTIFLGYISDKNDLNKQFSDNTILISTSIIETLGLHVIEAITNGIIAITPDEKYAKSVYGDIFMYKIFDTKSLEDTINKIILLSNSEIKNKIMGHQRHLIENQNQKFKNSMDIFSKVLLEEKNESINTTYLNYDN